MEEKRQYKRVPVDAIVLYQIQNYDKMPDSELSRIQSPVSVDVSEGGLKIEAEQKLPEDTYLKVTLSIPPERVPIELIGRVAWTRDSETPDHFWTGIEFVEFYEDKFKRLIADYVNSKE